MTTTTTTTTRPRELSLLAALCASLLACSKPIAGSGKIAHEQRKPGPFSEIAIFGDFDVMVRLGEPEHRLELAVDDNLLGEVRTETNGKRLVVDSAHPLKSSHVHLEINAPDVSLVRTKGTVSVSILGMANERFQLDLNGGGVAMASGSTEQLKVYVSGDATVAFKGLRVNGGALVDVNGAAVVEIAEPKQLEVEMHGAGTISYGGAPKITGQTIRGDGRLVKR